MLMSADAECRKILLIDDEPAIHKLFLRQFNSGWNIVSAYNGQEAIEKIKDNIDDFNIIILDMNMPVLNGEGFLEFMVENFSQKIYKKHIFLHSGDELCYEYLKAQTRFQGLRLYDFPKPDKFKDLLGLFKAK